MNPTNHPAFPRFEHNVAKRLERGAVEYGNRSLGRPPAELLDEIQQELEDTANWAAIMWLRLENLRAALRVVDGGDGA